MKLEHFDDWLAERGGPAALVRHQHLLPVEGPDGVFFPPSFASGDGFPGGYNIDAFPNAEMLQGIKEADRRVRPLYELCPEAPNVCLIDTIGSQANRIEPLFASGDWAKLIPQVIITAGEKRVNLVECGHRAGDAMARCSELQEELQEAFKTLQQKHNATRMAKIAPTSLVFGVWDSRDTQAKVPRLVNSTVRAFNVRVLHRSAQFNPTVNYVEEEIVEPPKDKKAEDAYSKRGFKHVPATWTHGGVMLRSDGSIRRDATISLAALRLLRAGDEDEATLALRRYVLGLALLAFTAEATQYLRQGCCLVPDNERPPTLELVLPSGEREQFGAAEADLLAYAQAAAEAFGVGDDREVAFDKGLAKADVKKKD